METHLFILVFVLPRTDFELMGAFPFDGDSLQNFDSTSSSKSSMSSIIFLALEMYLNITFFG